MPKSFAIAFLLVPALLLSACNTTKGIGRDIKSVGKTIERAAD
ncbi:MAG: entericidin A/B family lipoprotein [Sandarakinorhabdus sp.]|nr:entericidin A/B family lipoprotein [Sandarakinorhabdus sp.]